MLVQGGAHNVDVADLPFPYSVEGSPLHTGAYGHRLGSRESNSGSIVPGLFVRIFQDYGIGFLSLDGHPYLQLGLRHRGSGEHKLLFGCLVHAERHCIQAYAIDYFVVRCDGTEIRSVDGNGAAGHGFAVIVGGDTRDDRFRLHVGIPVTLAVAGEGGKGENRNKKKLQ